jgi:sec-independent protein translocase protein TatA
VRGWANVLDRIGAIELVIILVIVLMVFGAGKLPEIGSALGKSIGNFRKGMSGKLEEQEKAGKD